MNNARYTFLNFLRSNLDAIPLHYVHRDTNDPSAELLQDNAVNIEFINLEPRVAVTVLHTAVDIITDSETQAVDWSQSVWSVLSAAFMTPLLDFTNPTAPVPMSGNIMWGEKNLSFKKVVSDLYFRFTLNIAVSYHNPT